MHWYVGEFAGNIRSPTIFDTGNDDRHARPDVVVITLGKLECEFGHSDDDIDFTLAVVRASLGAMQEEATA